MTRNRSLHLVLVAGLAAAVIASAPAVAPAPATPFWQLHGAGILPAPEHPAVEQPRAAARDARMVRIAAAE